jgi:hypothetical protein
MNLEPNYSLTGYSANPARVHVHRAQRGPSPASHPLGAGIFLQVQA